MQLWIWQGLSLEHPVEWEMLQYSTRAAAGRCALADRHAYRLEVNWRRLPGAPDFEQMLAGYRRDLGGRAPAADIRRLDIGHWRGLPGAPDFEQMLAGYRRDLGGRAPAADIRRLDIGHWRGLALAHGGAETWRLGRFLEGSRCLVELVFIGPGSFDAELPPLILASVREEPPHDRLQRWRALGMDLRAAETLALERCMVQPARAEMHFADPTGQRQRESFQRLGLVPHWLRGSVARWLEDTCPAAATDRRRRILSDGGHQLDVLEADVPAGRRPLRWRRAVQRHQSAAWRCPADGRLYCVQRTAGAEESIEAEQLADRLVCCPARRTP